MVSRQWLDQRVQTGVPLTAPTLLVAEVAGAVSRRTGVAAIGHRAAQEIRSTPSVRLIWLDQTLATEAAHVAATMALRGADAVYVAVAR